MKCLSKKVRLYKENKQWEEWNKAEQEKLSQMTPEEQDAYKQARHKAAVDTLSNLASVYSVLGDCPYKI